MRLLRGDLDPALAALRTARDAYLDGELSKRTC
jgi:hypothetical protein